MFKQFYRMTAYALLLLMLTTGWCYAQQLTIGAQVRPRAEFRNGFKTLTVPDRDAAFFIEQRTRLFTDYRTDKYRIHINMQDVRTWGSVDQIFKTDPSLFNIYEGWGEYFFTPKFSTRLGRMALDYNNARFLGNLDWAAQGRSHDVLMLIYKDDEANWQLHAGTAFNQTGIPPEQANLSSTFYSGVANYKTMQFAWFQKQYDKTDFTLFFQNDGRQVTNAVDTAVAARQTYALIANRKGDAINAGMEFYYQGGENGTGTSVSAFLASAYVTYKTDITPITLGIDYLTGTSIDDTKDKSFDPLYGTNHKFYGFMDYFYVGNFHGQAATSSGLTNIFLKSSFKLGKNLRLNGDLHWFSSPATLYDPSDNTREIDSYLGTEIDLVLVWKPDPAITGNLGYSQMFAGSSMEAIKATPGDHTALNNWVWAMIGFSPTLFKKDFSKD